MRKGRVYGTVLVDIESRRPVDLLPAREAGTLVAWLTQHPGSRSSVATMPVLRRERQHRGTHRRPGSNGLPNPETVTGPEHARKPTVTLRQ
ncbi:hypothetical protein ACFRCI_15950 [Streptomyces sp. NPDC056638]|uniref:hypothetical protein n=1 Tax=Streptomyces sp. NPDC056638 TaxID=3345887 RepID=UPI00367C90B4